MKGSSRKVFTRVLFVILLLILFGIGIIWYLFSEKFENTSVVKADATILSTTLLQEFRNDLPAANLKYVEKIISVKGRISELEKADTTFNIKMTDSTGAYLIFALQADKRTEAAKVNEGDSISIKGSCSGGSFSSILGIVYIPFKRCIIEKIYK